MASCSYSSILKEKSSFPCGSNWKNPDDFSCVTLRDCNLDVASHLTSCKAADNRIENEMQLLLARAGTVLLFIIVIFIRRHFSVIFRNCKYIIIQWRGWKISAPKNKIKFFSRRMPHRAIRKTVDGLAPSERKNPRAIYQALIRDSQVSFDSGISQ